MPADAWIFDQDPWPARFDWGIAGARLAAARGDIVVVVDVLSFSSTTVTALDCGAHIFPYPMRQGAEAFAAEVGASVRLGDGVPKGRRALSPLSFSEADRGQKYVLCSPNGAACSRVQGPDAILLIGCLLNATAVADEADRLRQVHAKSVTVIACGERWADGCLEGDDDRLRPCVEDYVGAGAILARLGGEQSAEARLCAEAFRATRRALGDLVWDCASARELRARGFADDVRYCGRLDASTQVPRLAGLNFETASSGAALV